MQKFLRILMLAALFLPFALQAQTDVSIGDGGTTNNQYLPGYNYYNYSYTQQIYTDTEIGMAGTISSIAFKNTGAEKTRSYNIYMAHTSKQTFDGGSDWVAMSANDLVYTGTLTFTVGDWTTIDLDVPFTYDGTSNLIVSVADVTGSWTASPNMSCLVFDATSQAIYAYRDASAYDISNPNVSGSLATVKNQIILSIIPSGGQTCARPATLEASGITANEATLTWASTPAGSYQFEYKADADAVWNEITLTDNTYTLTNLQSSTIYNTRVKAICSNNLESNYRTADFITACDIFTLPYTETFDATSGSRNCWTLVSNNTENIGGSNGMGFVTVDNREVLRFSSYSTASDYNQYGFSPLLDVSSSAINLNVSVVYGTRENDFLYFGYVTATDTVWNSTPYNTNSDVSTINWETATIVIPATATQLAINYYGSYAWYAWIDSITITESTADYCFPANNLTASNITAHEATLTWNGDANSYSIYDLTDTSLVANVTDLTYSLSGLTSDSQHSYGVVANCTSSSSNMVAVSFQTLISCPAPTGVTVALNPNDPTEATLNWIENGTATDWQICINGDENNLINANDTTYTLTGLTPDSIYTAKVRAYCSADDQSAWSSTTSFEPTTKLVIGSGNTTSPYLPTYCFYNYSLTQQIYTAAELGDAGLIESIDFYNNSSSSATRNLSVYVVSTPKDTFASATDWISVTAADLQYSGSITFDAQAWTTIPLIGFAYDGLSNIAIIVDDNSGSYVSSVPFKTFAANQQALRIYSDGTNYEVTSPTYNGTVMNVKNQIRIAKGNLEGCLRPTGVNVAYNGGDEAVVTWNSDAASFNISVNGTETNNVTSPYTLTGLSLATTYTVSVQAVCDPISISDWTFPVSFTTDVCMPEYQCSISICAEDSYGDGWNGNTIHIIQNGIIVASYSMPDQSQYSTTVYDTFHVNVCSGIPVSFSWETGSFASETSFIIRDGGNAPVYTCANGSSLNDSVFFTLNEACPSCLPVSALYIDAVTENTITISWVGNAASYDVYNGENLEANVTTTSYTFTGLTAATSYTLGVIANCSASEQSSMITVTTSTECPDITSLPYDESFEDGLGCWNTVNGSSDGQPWTVNNCAGITGVNPHSGSYVASSWSWSSSAMHANAWLISPKFILPNTTEGLTLTWWEITNSGYPDSYSVVLSTTTNDTAAFTTVIYPYTQAAGDWTQKYVDLSAYAGQNIYIAFHHVDYNANYLLIDDVNMSVGGYVPPTPDTLTVTFAVNDATMGTTTPVPGTYQYITGDTVTFSATPNAGYHFVGWEWIIDNEVDTLGANYISAIFPVSSFINYGISSMSFTALFEADGTTTDSLTIYLSINDPTLGNITPAPGTYVLPLNDSLVLSATPNAGANFEGWRLIIAGQTVGTLPANPATFPVTAEAISFGQVSIVAIFSDSTSVPDSLTVVINTADATMGTTNPAPGTYNYAVGSQSILAAIPNEGYHNLYWIESITISGMTVSDTLYADTLSVTVSQMMAGVVLHITAYFEANQPGDFYNVSVTSANTSMGTVSSTASGSVAEGTEVTATATPLDGYRFVNWTNDAGVVVSTANPYTFTVTSDVTLIANFELIDGINDIDASSILIYTANSTINVRGAEGQDIYVYDMNGRCIYQQANANDTESISMSAAGIYVVRVSNVLYKKVVIVK